MPEQSTMRCILLVHCISIKGLMILVGRGALEQIPVYEILYMYVCMYEYMANLFLTPSSFIFIPNSFFQA